MSVLTIKRLTFGERATAVKQKLKLLVLREQFWAMNHRQQYPQRRIDGNQEPVNLSEDGSVASIRRHSDANWKERLGRFIGGIWT